MSFDRGEIFLITSIYEKKFAEPLWCARQSATKLEVNKILAIDDYFETWLRINLTVHTRHIYLIEKNITSSEQRDIYYERRLNGFRTMAFQSSAYFVIYKARILNTSY